MEINVKTEYTAGICKAVTSVHFYSSPRDTFSFPLYCLGENYIYRDYLSITNVPVEEFFADVLKYLIDRYEEYLYSIGQIQCVYYGGGVIDMLGETFNLGYQKTGEEDEEIEENKRDLIKKVIEDSGILGIDK